MLIKYRIHEVAKDFNLTSKEIAEILTEYATTPKNHMQVLETPELDLIFEYLTQHRQIASLEEVFMDDKPKAKRTEAAQPAAGNAPAAANVPAAAAVPAVPAAPRPAPGRRPPGRG